MENQNNSPSNAKKSRGRPRSWDNNTAQNTIKSLDRALEVFEYLSATSGKQLSELASELSQAPATVYRILVTLEARGFVEFDASMQHWHVGPRAFVVGSRFLRRTNLVDRARPILRRLMEETGETANLGIEQAGNVLFVSQVETHESIRAFFPPGTLSPMHASGIGKILLAHMDEERFKRWFKGRELKKFTPNTKTEFQDLIAFSHEARKIGYALDGEEKNLGMRCIAAPVFDVNQEAIAGISVSGPTSRVNEETTSELALAVRSAAQDLSDAIGGR